MSDRDTFGPRLRRERERRGITLESMAAATKVAPDLWDAMERNDFSRWPSGIFARAFIRDYARRVNLDADEVVDEFCRLFPNGDRRASRVLIAQGQLIGHRTDTDDPTAVPREGERRAAALERRAEARLRQFQMAPRTMAAVLDLACTASLAAIGSFAGAGFWASLGVASLLYYGSCTTAIGTSAGVRLVAFLQVRVPALFTAPNRRAHA